MLEEDVERAALRLMSVDAELPLHLPDFKYSEEILDRAAENTINKKDEEGNPRFVAFDHFGSNSIDTILGLVDEMASAGCNYIFLDHISIVVSDQQNLDERKALDEIATKLRTKVQEKDIGLFIVSHLRRTNAKPHEEGGQTSLQDIRGTQAVAQLSDLVLGLERNGQSEDEVERNTTKVRVLKNRFSGLTGLTSLLYYDRVTGRLREIPTDVEGNPTEDKPVFDNSNVANIVEKQNPEIKPVDWEDGDELPF